MIALRKDMWYVKWFRYVLEMKFRLDNPTHQDELLYWYPSESTALEDATTKELLNYLRLGVLNLCLFVRVTTYMYIGLLIRKHASILLALSLNIMSWLWFYAVIQRPEDVLWFNISLIIITVVSAISFFILVFWLEEKWKEWKYKQPIKNREESFINRIVKPYFKARKESICPFIEIKD